MDFLRRRKRRQQLWRRCICSCWCPPPSPEGKRVCSWNLLYMDPNPWHSCSVGFTNNISGLPLIGKRTSSGIWVPWGSYLVFLASIFLSKPPFPSYSVKISKWNHIWTWTIPSRVQTFESGPDFPELPDIFHREIRPSMKVDVVKYSNLQESFV